MRSMMPTVGEVMTLAFSACQCFQAAISRSKGLPIAINVHSIVSQATVVRLLW
ncbi:hypothetical protein ABIF68_011019 [Bradyrhizobium japonicum]|uniref:hypothetical protein n=1 Tax=Bradyrhizobium japonicum TaxID=375 RepID=UPI0012FDF982|nr:hypothetical protein [Bradyrhizobium japonicum]